MGGDESLQRANLKEGTSSEEQNETIECKEGVAPVPLKERQFLEDQRTSRKMMMGSVDYKAVRQQKKIECRKYAEEIRKNEATVVQKQNSVLGLKKISKTVIFLLMSSETINKMKIPVLAEILDRYAISDRAGAAIASAVLQDYGLVSDRSSENVIDRHKIRKARQKNRNNLQTVSNSILKRGLYFDGRKYKTLTYSENRKRMVTEEHVVLIEEPDSKYIGHISPKSGSALSILNAITEFFEKQSNALDCLEVIGCDGTNTNIGNKNGVITKLERNLKRPLQWFVCMLHANELPLRHLLQHLDGETTGPRAFGGSIGKSLSSCEKLPIVEFSKINGELPVISEAELSTDQKVQNTFLRWFNLPEDLKCLVHKVINRNRYFGHPENVLLCMLFDERLHIRRLAYLKIMKARASEAPENEIRYFSIPSFNFDAKDYYELVDWQNVVWSEPPITTKLTKEDLEEVVQYPESSAISYVRNYPCHSQAVERAVKCGNRGSCYCLWLRKKRRGNSK
ncbi:unnamed protein product [Psylliodes chrysocephalus]|uniref:Uncharacterized protein n=1 Tax=Psylliodes chrysocephalus TaxID=3402493 RepID=A0A9P0CVE5_9CUCU|nr:unnamed protein product [Psylliodes chrysocephala]